jgi:hypothetical protein
MIREKQEFKGTFPSVLTEACGFPVTFTVSGTLTNLKFPHQAVGPQEIRISNAVMIFKAGDKTVRFQNVGTVISYCPFCNRRSGSSVVPATGWWPCCLASPTDSAASFSGERVIVRGGGRWD